VSKQEALRAEAAGGPDPVHSGPVMHLSQPLGVNCTTRHQGVNKPLNDVLLLRNDPRLNVVRNINAPPPIRQRLMGRPAKPAFPSPSWVG
jgi:hypothetical protein